jgi:hypothetical protein
VDRHVRLLGILVSLWGALSAVVGVSMLLLTAGALVEFVDPMGRAVEFAATVTAGVFALIGVFALVWGGVHIWTGALLRRHRPAGRVVGLGLALVNLVLLPFGTALAVYALWVLLTNDGRRLFDQPAH